MFVYIFFLVLLVSICYSFCSVLQEKKLFQFYRLLKSVFLFGITRKKKLFQFYRLLKSMILFGITRKKIVSVLQVTQIFVSVRYYKEKKIVTVFFFRLYYICYRLYKFLFLFLDNRQQQDCSFFQFLLYSNFLKTTVFPFLLY